MDASFTADGQLYPNYRGYCWLDLRVLSDLSAKQLKQCILASATPLTGTWFLNRSTTEGDFSTFLKQAVFKCL